MIVSHDKIVFDMLHNRTIEYPWDGSMTTSKPYSQILVLRMKLNKHSLNAQKNQKRKFNRPKVIENLGPSLQRFHGTVP